MFAYLWWRCSIKGFWCEALRAGRLPDDNQQKLTLSLICSASTMTAEDNMFGVVALDCWSKRQWRPFPSSWREVASLPFASAVYCHYPKHVKYNTGKIKLLTSDIIFGYMDILIQIRIYAVDVPSALESLTEFSQNGHNRYRSLTVCVLCVRHSRTRLHDDWWIVSRYVTLVS